MLTGRKKTVFRARQLRRELTLPEGLLWRELRRRPGSFKFRRQHPAGTYVLDFFCAEAQLAIEVDGDAHDMGDRPERDQVRDAWLSNQGVDVLRISAKLIFEDMPAVVEAIVQNCMSRRPLHRPADVLARLCPRHNLGLLGASQGQHPPRTGEE